jgi:hypothetical protein
MILTQDIYEWIVVIYKPMIDSTGGALYIMFENHVRS